MNLPPLKTAGIALACGIAAGLVIGWLLWKPKRTVETYVPAVVQQDGSLILERKPDPDAKPKQQLPRGAKVERVVSVVVTPRTPTESPQAKDAPPSATPCPPVTVDLTLARMPDGTRRVIASSPDGEVAGVDIPVESAAPLKLPKWTATALVGWDVDRGKVYGAMVSRRSGPFVAQAGVIGKTAFVGVGVTW